jgi:hypothetical protein
MAMSPRLLRPKASGAFTPKSISGLKLWLDADDASAFTLVSGNVSEWRDKSGSGVPHATQASAGARPARTSSGLNGRAVVDFQGTHTLTFASSTAAFNFLHNPTGGTVFLVLKPDTSSNPDAVKYILNNTNNSSANTGVSILVDDRSSVSRNNFLSANVNRGVSGVTTSAFAANNFIPAMDSYLVTTLVMDNGNAVAASRLLGRANGVQNAAANSLTNAAATGNATLDLTMGNFGGGGACSGVAEVIFYEGVLSASAIARVERYLSTKWAITLGVPTATNADAQAWIDRVYSNGGTVSTATANAVNTFCNDIESAGIRDRFYRLNLFAGTGLSAALVPLFRGPSLGGAQYGGTTDTNVGPFVSGDYVETGATGGLLGNGTSKHLNTGFRTQDFASVSDVHLGIWWRGGTVTDTRRPIGGFGASNDNFHIDTRLAAGGGNLAVLGQSTSIPTNVLDQSEQSIIASRTSTTNAVYYKNGTSAATSTTSVTGVTGTSQVIGVFTGLFSGTTAAAWSPHRLNGYSIGAGLSGAQASAFHTAWSAFQTALTRGL